MVWVDSRAVGRITVSTPIAEMTGMPAAIALHMISIFAVNAAWSDFLLPYLVLRGADKQTVMVRLFVFSTEQTVNADAMMRSVVFAMVPPIILFFIFQKQLTENAVSVGIKG